MQYRCIQYRCEATTIEGFVQQLVLYLRHGYFFYVTGVIPDHKDPQAIDGKLIERYGIRRSRWARVRRKGAGWANIHYLRVGRFWVLLSTHGAHPFFDEERDNLRDGRKVSIKIGGYSISFRRGHASVRIEREEYKRLKAHFVELARHRSAERLATSFYDVPFEPYAGVREQLRNILRAVNRVRRAAGFVPIPIYCLPYKRRSVKVFHPAPKVRDAA